MPERDNRPPQLVLPVIAPGGKPDSVAFNNAFQLWARDLNAWLNDNLAPAAESKPATSAQPTAHKLLYRGTEYTHPGLADDCTSRFCVDEDSLPRPEWLPDDAEDQLMNTVLTGSNLVNLVARWYNESAYAGRPWLQINEKIAADLGQRCNQLVAERDKALVDLKFAKHDAETCAAERDKAIQERDTARHFSDLHKQQRNDYYQRAARAEKDSAKWEKAWKDEYTLVRRAFDRIVESGGASIGTIVARVDHLIAHRDVAKQERDEFAEELASWKRGSDLLQSARDSARRRAEAVEAKVDPRHHTERHAHV